MGTRRARLRSAALAPVRVWRAFVDVLASGRLARYDADADAGMWLLLLTSGSADGSWFAALPDLGRPEGEDQQLDDFSDRGPFGAR